MKTTIYINRLLLEKLNDSSQKLNISKNELIAILLSRIVCKNRFVIKLHRAIKYQDSNQEIGWKTVHVKFDPSIYEKAQDLRRNFKFSVSWFISYAIINCIDEIVNKLNNSENKSNLRDNYTRNYIYIAKMFGQIQGFIFIWGLPEEKYLDQLLN